ncbi:MAG: hypothetical protein MK082_00995 [Phycisphaerales bacterium]|nr:hypothetical protein [Phycisphaerales bacterium]
MTDANCPMDRAAVIDRYFLEHRAKLIDLAAFLDRVDRSGDGTVDDFRITAFRKAIEELLESGPGRARRVQEAFSDHSTEPIEQAPMKGALGAFNPNDQA